MSDQEPQGLSHEEQQQFIDLLRRYCMHDLDQWANFKVKQTPPYGPVYVMIGRMQEPGTEDYLWREV